MALRRPIPPNQVGALTAMDLKFMGPNYSISSACASGNFAILNAADHIRKARRPVNYWGTH